MGNGIIKRIDKELDSQINDLAKKNNMKYREASREVANMVKQVRGKSFTREIRF